MNNWIKRVKESTFLERLLTFTIILGVITFIMAFFFFKSGENFTYEGLIKSDKFGQFGDFVGGIAGTLFSIATTILIYLTYEMQKVELAETKEALREQQKSLGEQKEVMNKQRQLIDEQIKLQRLERFDNIFFPLLERYQTSDFIYTNSVHIKFDKPFSFKLHFQAFNDNYSRRNVNKTSIKDKFSFLFERQEQNSERQQYFNKLLYTVAILDSFELQQNEKNKYVNTYLKPHLDKYEVILLFYFGLSDYGKKYKHLIEKYVLIENIDIKILINCKEHWKDYDGESYNFGEELNKKLPTHPYKLPPQ
jgi:hypothetical protein